jgi:hypothetical protein
MMNNRAKLCAAAIVALTGAEQGAAAAIDAENDNHGRAKILSVETAVNPRSALQIDFEVTTSKPASIVVTYFDPLEPEYIRSKPTALDTVNDFTIVRLKADTGYQYKVVATDQYGKRSKPAYGTFRTGSLPPGLTQPITRIENVKGPGTTYPTLFDFNHSDPPVAGQTTTPFNGHVVLDGKARVIWYHANEFRPRAGHSKAPFEIDRMANGNFVHDIGPAGRSWDGRLLEITPYGEVVHIGPSICTSGTGLPGLGGAHHEITPLADGNVLYLGRRVDRFTGLTTLQEQTTIREWDPITNDDREVWRPAIFFDPVTHRGVDSNATIALGCNRQLTAQEWMHGNALTPGLSGKYLFNSRYLNETVSLASAPDPRSPSTARCNPAAVGRSDLQCVQWILGGPLSDFTFPDPADRFWGQHSPFEIPNPDPNKTNILVYDNGFHRPEGQYTRALELELDFTTMTARKVWEYRHEPDIFTAAVGRVMRLDNGNTLVNFGFGTNPTQNDPNVTHHIVEVTRDGVVMADIELKSFGKAVQYRSHVIPSISGEQVVTADDYYEEPSAFESIPPPSGEEP